MPKLGEVKLKFAPGIFFAILGAAIIYFSLERPIQISESINTSDLKTTDGTVQNFDFKNRPLPRDVKRN